MSVDIERYSSSALVRFSLEKDKGWLFFSIISSFKPSCLTISGAGSEMPF